MNLARTLPRLAAPALLLFASGCLATRQEIEDLRVDILRLQNTLSKVQSNQSDSSTALQGNQADLMTQMDALSRRLEALNAHLDESGNRMTLMSTRMDDLDKNLSNRLDLLSELMSGSKLAAAPPPSTLFNLAYGDFTRRRYEQALKGFGTYLEKYADTDKAAEAQFYVGESRAARLEWTEALAAYEKVLVDYSTSTVVPTAYLQKAQALEKAGRAAESVPVYEAVVRKYPHRREAMTAQSRLDALKNAPPSVPEPR